MRVDQVFRPRELDLQYYLAWCCLAQIFSVLVERNTLERKILPFSSTLLLKIESNLTNSMYEFVSSRWWSVKKFSPSTDFHHSAIEYLWRLILCLSVSYHQHSPHRRAQDGAYLTWIESRLGDRTRTKPVRVRGNAIFFWSWSIWPYVKNAQNCTGTCWAGKWARKMRVPQGSHCLSQQNTSHGSATHHLKVRLAGNHIATWCSISL